VAHDLVNALPTLFRIRGLGSSQARSNHSRVDVFPVSQLGYRSHGVNPGEHYSIQPVPRVRHDHDRAQLLRVKQRRRQPLLAKSQAKEAAGRLRQHIKKG
jgi:hypothetical protein